MKNKKKIKKTKWEKEFDKKFHLIDDMDWDRDLQEEVKSFIRKLLE